MNPTKESKISMPRYFMTPSQPKRSDFVSRIIELNSPDKFSQVLYDFGKLKDVNETGFISYSSCITNDNGVELKRPFIQGKSLAKFLAEKSRLTSIEVNQIAISIMSIVYRLHSFGISLFNLTPSNIIILPTGEINIVDCGYSFIYADKLTRKMNAVVTLFSGPENFNGLSNVPLLCEKHDIWCLGLIFYYIFFGEYPYDTSSISNLKAQFSNYSIIFPPQIDAQFHDLLSKMLNKSPEQRPSASYVLQTLSGLPIPDNFVRPVPLKKSNSFCHPEKNLENINDKNGLSEELSSESVLVEQTEQTYCHHSHSMIIPVQRQNHVVKSTRTNKGKTVHEWSAVDSNLILLKAVSNRRPRSHSISVNDVEMIRLDFM